MTIIQIDRDLKDRLAAGRQPVQLRDQEGNLVGFFVPAGVDDADLWVRARRAFTDDEIEHARQQSGGFTWKEIRDELEEKWPST